jgi:hypothetical protein
VLYTARKTTKRRGVPIAGWGVARGTVADSTHPERARRTQSQMLSHAIGSIGSAHTQRGGSAANVP